MNTRLSPAGRSPYCVWPTCQPGESRATEGPGSLSACLASTLHKHGNPGDTVSEASWAWTQAPRGKRHQHQQPVWRERAQLTGVAGMECTHGFLMAMVTPGQAYGQHGGASFPVLGKEPPGSSSRPLPPRLPHPPRLPDKAGEDSLPSPGPAEVPGGLRVLMEPHHVKGQQREGTGHGRGLLNSTSRNPCPDLYHS